MIIPTFSDIEAAADVLAPHNVETPLVENAELNARLGGRLFLKLETLQRTGSFKFRGAMNRISRIPSQDRARGVVAFSSGNHAQGVAAAAALLGIPALIVMPKDAPRTKVQGTRARGAEVVFYDRQTDDREAIALRICEERGATLIRPFDDPYIVAGQGTIGLEIARAAAARGVQLDAVLAPCSGGGLVSGIALAFATQSPSTGVGSVEPENFDGMRRSLVQRRRVAAPGGRPSVADALMAPTPGEVPFAIAQCHLRFALAVRDEDMTSAAAEALSSLKILVEPSGAAALAAALTTKFPVSGKNVAVVLSGANCDVAPATTANTQAT
ncbi:MAG: threonine/serine dehydratase [Alphaproteobacteria bacterium]|nr:threonine/serine dehydratase [Alphaproteobacteria bacterium]